MAMCFFDIPFLYAFIITLLHEITGATKVRNWKLEKLNLRNFFEELEFQVH